MPSLDRGLSRVCQEAEPEVPARPHIGIAPGACKVLVALQATLADARDTESGSQRKPYDSPNARTGC